MHSGDSACVIPPPTLSDETLEVIGEHTRAIAEELDVRGLINVQYAVKHGQVFVIEANPRASRTVPFVAKATGVPLVKIAARVMVGATLERAAGRGPAGREGHRRPRRRQGGGAAVRPLPRRRHRARPRDAVDRRGHGHRPDRRPGLRQEPDRGGRPAARVGHRVPVAGRPGQGHRRVRGPACSRELGFAIAATVGTAAYLEERGVEVATVLSKVGEEGGGLDAIDLIESGKVDLVVNSPRGRGPRADGDYIRRAAAQAGIPVRDHRRGRPGRRPGHGRLVPPRAPGADAAGVPPGRPRRPAEPAPVNIIVL